MYGSVTNIHVKENLVRLITIICFKKYRKILFDEALYGYITINYFKK